MGAFLNSKKSAKVFKSTFESLYYVDKSLLLNDMLDIVDDKEDYYNATDPSSARLLYLNKKNRYICVTRPRRFGKSVNAAMIATFFSKGLEADPLFHSLAIHNHPLYEKHLNKHDVFYIDMSKACVGCKTYEEAMNRFKETIRMDLRDKHGQEITDDKEVIWILEELFEKYDDSYIFVIDEWDYLFERYSMPKHERKEYIDYLGYLLKDQGYVDMCYMTGITPINSLSSGTSLNMFTELNMAGNPMYSEYFGFTDNEVDQLYQRYLSQKKDDKTIARKELADWYDGYCVQDRTFHLYNPESVSKALESNSLKAYWSSSGRYDEIYTFVSMNIDEIKDDIAMMITGEAVSVGSLNEYASTVDHLENKNQIYSAMLVYGFLTYNKKTVFIPNQELMIKFIEMMQNHSSLGYLNRLAIESEAVVKATRNLDADALQSIVSFVHDKEIPLFKYNNEDSFAAIISLLYSSIRDTRLFTREEKGGTGYADILMKPKEPTGDCFIVELKVDDTPQNALAQIKNKKYFLSLLPSFAEKKHYTGRIILAAICYSKKDPVKTHQVMFEEVKL